jgi:hypothetical protein
MPGAGKTEKIDMSEASEGCEPLERPQPPSSIGNLRKLRPVQITLTVKKQPKGCFFTGMAEHAA